MEPGLGVMREHRLKGVILYMAGLTGLTLPCHLINTLVLINRALILGLHLHLALASYWQEIFSVGQQQFYPSFYGCLPRDHCICVWPGVQSCEGGVGSCEAFPRLPRG